VGLLALALLAGLVAGGTALWAAVRPDPAATPSAPPTPTGPTDAELSNPVACAPDAPELSIDLAGASLPHGRTAAFPTTGRNAGEVPCLADLGYAALELTLYSGDDRVWSTTDCHGERPEHQEYLFDLGYSQSVTISWQGRRSTPGCAGDQNYAEKGAYRAQVTLHPVVAADETGESADGDAPDVTESRVFGLD